MKIRCLKRFSQKGIINYHSCWSYGGILQPWRPRKDRCNSPIRASCIFNTWDSGDVSQSMVANTHLNGPDAATKFILISIPSPSNLNNSLCWPNWKKYIAFTSVCAFTFLTNNGISSLAPAFYTLPIESNILMTETSHLLLWPILVSGVFFSWVLLGEL